MLKLKNVKQINLKIKNVVYTMTYEPLYKKTKNGKVKIWTISVIKETETRSVIRIITGLIDGKMTTFDVIILDKKNVGKTNETTQFIQAQNEAKSKWNKKIDTGFTVDASGETSEKLIFPMLAHDYSDSKLKLVYPCFFQPKLDGVRAIFQNGKLHSRGIKPFPNLKHITDELPKTYNLDGELYSDDLSFQEISGIVRKVKLTEQDNIKILKIQFRVYDMVSQENFSERLTHLKELFNTNKFKYSFLVKTDVLSGYDNTEIVNQDHPKLVKIHDTFIKQGYEGVILRNFNGEYEENTRSYNLQKVKRFDDSEFKIVNFKDGVGKEAGAIIWECVANNGQTFNVRPSGSVTERKKLFKSGNKFIGNLLNVRYFGLTDDGIPRFPVGNGIRNMDY